MFRETLEKTSMSRSQLLPVLMLLWAVCSVSEAQAEMKTVKLCGREFIRAVVYTCGGSRWRRLSSLEDLEGLGELDGLEDLDKSSESELTRRDTNLLLTKMCCQSGCKKSDLTFLC